MKKLSLRDTLILAVILIGVVGWATFTYYLVPRIATLAQLETQISGLKAVAQTKDSQTKDLESLRKKSSDQKTRIGAYKEAKNGFVLNAQNLLAYMGPVAENNNVSITLFKELEHDSSNAQYIKVPYHIVIQGDYSNLLKVMKSLSDLNYNYTISEYSMKVIDVNPKTNKPVTQTSATGEYKWTSGNNTYVTGEFPLFKVDSVQSQTTSQNGQTSTSGASGTSGTSGTSTTGTSQTGANSGGNTEDFTPIKKVQIEFKLNFILFADQNQNSKDTAPTGDVGKTDPFQSEVNADSPSKSDDSNYTGDDLVSVSDSQKAIFMADKTKVQDEINKTLKAIYNREQKKMDTSKQLGYLKQLLAIRDGGQSGQTSTNGSTGTATDGSNGTSSTGSSSTTETATDGSASTGSTQN